LLPCYRFLFPLVLVSQSRTSRATRAFYLIFIAAAKNAGAIMSSDRKHFRQRCTWPISVAVVTVVFFVLFYAYDTRPFSGDSSVIA
jgi:hypothetical protein